MLIICQVSVILLHTPGRGEFQSDKWLWGVSHTIPKRKGPLFTHVASSHSWGNRSVRELWRRYSRPGKFKSRPTGRSLLKPSKSFLLLLIFPPSGNHWIPKRTSIWKSFVQSKGSNGITFGKLQNLAYKSKLAGPSNSNLGYFFHWFQDNTQSVDFQIPNSYFVPQHYQMEMDRKYLRTMSFLVYDNDDVDPYFIY